MNKNLAGGISLLIVVVAVVLAFYGQYLLAWIVIAANAGFLFWVSRRKD